MTNSWSIDGLKRAIELHKELMQIREVGHPCSPDGFILSAMQWALTQLERPTIEQMIEEQTKIICASEESARDWLVKLGTHTPDGKLTPEYGGED